MMTPRLYEGRQAITANWSVMLPFPMAMRIEDGSIVFWDDTDYLTLWFTVAQGAPGARGLIAFDELKEGVPQRALDRIEERRGQHLCFAYRMGGGAFHARLPALYGFTVAEHGENVRYAAYFDTAARESVAMATWRTIEWNGS